MSIASRLPATGPARLFTVGLIAGVLAAVLNLIVYAIAAAVGVPFDVQMGPGAPIQPIGALQFIMASIVPALIGTGLYALLVRFTRNATPIFIGIAIVVALLSLASPLGMQVALSTRLTLAVLHLTTAAIITLTLLRLAPQGR